MNAIREIVLQIQKLCHELGRPVNLMEVCGTHTVAIFRHGIRSVLPENLRLLSGPGCPVCVTSIADVDRAISISEEANTVLTTFGDMMRVPGSGRNLLEARSEGARVEVVYSPLDALDLAKKSPEQRIVFFATGFETTSPLIAATLERAAAEGVDNFLIYPVHKLVPPALRALLEAPELTLDGFILPGHVSTIIGIKPYEFLPSEFHRPGVITGFEPEEILSGILMLLAQLRADRPRIEIQYSSVVQPEGNPRATELLEKYFTPSAAHWRGIGELQASGLALRPEYSRFLAEPPSSPATESAPEPAGCACGEVLRGLKEPPECKLFGTACTPEKPVGACMVSSEGSCAAWYKYSGVLKHD